MEWWNSVGKRRFFGSRQMDGMTPMGLGLGNLKPAPERMKLSTEHQSSHDRGDNMSVWLTFCTPENLFPIRYLLWMSKLSETEHRKMTPSTACTASLWGVFFSAPNKEFEVAHGFFHDFSIFHIFWEPVSGQFRFVQGLHRCCARSYSGGVTSWWKKMPRASPTGQDFVELGDYTTKLAGEYKKPL